MASIDFEFSSVLFRTIYCTHFRHVFLLQCYRLCQVNCFMISNAKKEKKKCNFKMTWKFDLEKKMSKKQFSIKLTTQLKFFGRCLVWNWCFVWNQCLVANWQTPPVHCMFGQFSIAVSAQRFPIEFSESVDQLFPVPIKLRSYQVICMPVDCMVEMFSIFDGIVGVFVVFLPSEMYSDNLPADMLYWYTAVILNLYEKSKIKK